MHHHHNGTRSVTGGTKSHPCRCASSLIAHRGRVYLANFAPWRRVAPALPRTALALLARGATSLPRFRAPFPARSADSVLGTSPRFSRRFSPCVCVRVRRKLGSENRWRMCSVLKAARMSSGGSTGRAGGGGARLRRRPLLASPPMAFASASPPSLRLPPASKDETPAPNAYTHTRPFEPTCLCAPLLLVPAPTASIETKFSKNMSEFSQTFPSKCLQNAALKHLIIKKQELPELFERETNMPSIQETT